MIAARQLLPGVELTRGEETLTFRSLEKEGLKKIAVVEGPKGIERLTMSDLLSQGVSLKSEVKTKAPKREKPPVDRAKSDHVQDKVVNVKTMKRAGGIATLNLGKDGRVISSSWVRREQEKTS
jgi:hypothetical protein